MVVNGTWYFEIFIGSYKTSRVWGHVSYIKHVDLHFRWSTCSHCVWKFGK